MKTTFLTCAACAMGIAALAAPVRAIDVAAPATQPAVQISPEVAALISQLGDPDFHVRLDAARKLKEMGPPIIPAMKEARRSSNPEVHARADDILEELAPHDVTSIPQATSFGNQMMRVSAVNGNRCIDVQQPGRAIHIEVGAASILLKVTGQIDGRRVTREFKVKTPDDLKKANPEAFEIFQQFAGNMNFGHFQVGANAIRVQANVRININGGGGIGAGAGGGQAVNRPPFQLLPVQPAIPRLNPAGADDLQNLEDNLMLQMKARNLPQPQQEEVKGLLTKLREARPQLNNNADINVQMRDYNLQCDALRKRLAELNLPDPGNALPPPASGRLGVSVNEETAAGQGLVIVHVLPGSRAANMGLQDQDVIQKVNGQEVHSTRELRKIVTERHAGLIVEGLRDGKPFVRSELHESPELPRP